MKKNTKLFMSIFLLLSLLVSNTCEMVYINNPDDPANNQPPGLTIQNLPGNVSKHHFTHISIYSSQGVIAKCINISDIKITSKKTSATAFIPLVYSSDEKSTFVDSGQFLLTFNANIDFFTHINYSHDDHLYVNFIDGHASLDINAITNVPIITPPSLKIESLPPNTNKQSFSNVFIYNSAGKIAYCVDYSEIIMDYYEESSTATIPLVYSSNDEPFRNTGNFLVSFTANIDFSNQIVITPNDNILVSFQNGYGSLDILDLPLSITSEQKYPSLTIQHLPPNTSSYNFTNVSIYNISGLVAKCSDFSTITVTSNADHASACIPLVFDSNDKILFNDTGIFLVSFTVNIDFSNQIIVTKEDNLLVSFKDGFATLDIQKIPERIEVIKEIPVLTIHGLPSNTSNHNFTQISVYNVSGIVAECVNFSTINITSDPESDGKYAIAAIPLIYYSNNKLNFDDTGSFLVSFTVHIDFSNQIVITKEDNILVYFQNGFGTFDISNIPEKIIIENKIPVFTIQGLPPNTSNYNFTQISVYNVSGIVAECVNFSTVNITSDPESKGKYTIADIPLVFYSNNKNPFNDTGFFLVSFTVHVDFSNQIVVTKDDNVLVSFSNGFGTLNILDIPEKIEIIKEIPILTIQGLPSNTSNHNFTKVTVYNITGVVAECVNFSTVNITPETKSGKIYARAAIPLVFYSNNKVNFDDTGIFLISFTVNVDFSNQIVVTKDDNVLVSFNNGFGAFDIIDIPEKIEVTNEVPALTIKRLPLNTSNHNFTNVTVYNVTGIVAECINFSTITITSDNKNSSASIPLVFRSNNKVNFDDTGTFLVAFTVNVDFSNQIVVTKDDNVLVSFNNGFGTFDIINIPEKIEVTKEIPALTIKRLPLNTSNHNFTNVTVYNITGIVAECINFSTITITSDNKNSSASIPLVFRSNNKVNFDDTGTFLVAFTVNVDFSNQIVVTKDDNVLVSFNNGFGAFDIINIPEKIEVTKEVPALTIKGLPLNTSNHNFTNVTVYNVTGIVAECINFSTITVTSDSKNSSASIPLVFRSNSKVNFDDTGTFLVAFTVNIDFSNQIVMTKDNNILVSFKNGFATLNISDIPEKIDIVKEIPALTIKGLPLNTSKNNFSQINLYNTAGIIAKCSDFSSITVTVNSGYATAAVQLTVNNNSKEYFRESGTFLVTITAHVDMQSNVIISESDNILVTLINGSGTLNLLDLPTPPIPPEQIVSTLTIIGLPPNTSSHNFSNIFLHNTSSIVAKCKNYYDITITSDSVTATAVIPIVYNNNNDYFRDTGIFLVTFSAYIDMFSQIVKTVDDGLLVTCNDGSGEVDLRDSFGYFSGALTNPTTTDAPILKRGTKFELNGSYYTLSSDTPIPAHNITTNTQVYVYVYFTGQNITFEYSTDSPAWNEYKNAFYLGDKRALYKFILIKTSTDIYFSKTFINDDYKHLLYQTINSNFSFTGTSIPNYYSLDGFLDLPPVQIQLVPGVYILEIAGAKGGNGGTKDSAYPGGVGGEGGFVSEALIITKNTTFDMFTGSSGNKGYSGDKSLSNSTRGPGGGGGGGSGTFVFTSEGYFLCAGGGGGGAGSNYNSTNDNKNSAGGGGGGGGAIGSGAGGGGGGPPQLFRAHEGGDGGDGGGYNFGTGAAGTKNEDYTPSAGKDGYNALVASGTSFSGAGTIKSLTGSSTYESRSSAGGKTGYIDLASPNTWRNTNGANGQGGSNSTAGTAGGNNRNSTRGGNINSNNGFINIYKFISLETRSEEKPIERKEESEERRE